MMRLRRLPNEGSARVFFSIALSALTGGAFRFVHSRCPRVEKPERSVIKAHMYSNCHSPSSRSCAARANSSQHGTLVLKSHTSFDEVLTTGWNEAFADAIGVRQDGRVCLAGYKNNPDRRIGLLGRMRVPALAETYAERISQAFGGHDAILLPESGTEDEATEAQSAHDTLVDVLVSLNAFTPEVLTRVVSEVETLGSSASRTIAVTGAIREPGMEEARRLGLSVVAVGHKRCEDWGIRYLIERAKARYPSMQVQWVDEEELPPPPKPAKSVPVEAVVDAPPKQPA